MKKIIGKLFGTATGILVYLGFGRISQLWGLYKFLLSRVKPDFIIIDGHKLFLDKLDSLGLFLHRSYEEYETEIVKKIIKKGETVVDVGANIGYFTLIFAKLVGKNGKVFAFEPDPSNLDLLKKNIETNGYKNVILVNKALSSKTGTTKLFLSDINLGDHMIVDAKENRSSIEIDTITGDDYFSGFMEKINFIKMDIQGAETDSIIGMSSLLGKMTDVKIMIEFAPKKLKNFGHNPIELLNILTENDFKLFEINDDKKKIIPTNSQVLIKKYPPDMRKYTNLLLSRDGHFSHL